MNMQNCRIDTKCNVWTKGDSPYMHWAASLTPYKAHQIFSSSAAVQQQSFPHDDFITRQNSVQQLHVMKSKLQYTLTAFEDMHRHYLQALLLASQNEFAELKISWEGVKVPGAVGRPALPAPAAGGGALGEAELKPQVSHSRVFQITQAEPSPS